MSKHPIPDRRGSVGPSRIDWHGRRFLLVEDNEDHQWLMSAVLRDTGADVSVVDCGEAAIEAVRASETGGGPAIDLVLMDIRLPTLDGYETTQKIRAMGYGGPIIAITARAMEAEIEKCHDSGCDACVRKPFDRSTLCGTIEELLMETATNRPG